MNLALFGNITTWVIGLVAIGTLVILWRALRPRHDFSIVIGENRVDIQGKLTAPQRSTLAYFFRNDAQLEPGVRILGKRGADGRIRLQFRGPVDPEVQQRIRNFMLTVL